MSKDDKHPIVDAVDKAAGIKDTKQESKDFDRKFSKWMSDRDKPQGESPTPKDQPEDQNSSDQSQKPSDKQQKEMEDDILSEEDTGPDSQSTKDSCEKCDADKIKCLCHVEIETYKPKKKYLWKGRTVGELTGTGVSIVTTQPYYESSQTYDNSDEKQKIYEPYKLSYEIKSSQCRGAKGPFPEKCTLLYYCELYKNYQFIDKSATEGGKQSDSQEKRAIGPIIQKGQGKEDIEFEFNEKYLEKDSGQSIIPVYLKTETQKVDGKEITIYSKYDNSSRLIRDPIGKWGEHIEWNFLGAEKLPSGSDSIEFFTQFFSRVWYFGFHSKLDYMPTTPFHISALECKDQDISFLTGDEKDLLKYTDFNEAKMKLFLIPDYSCELKIDFGFKDAGLATLEDFKKILDKFHFDISLKEKFYYGAGEVAENEVGIKLVDAIKFLAKECKGKGILGMIIQLYCTIKDFVDYYYLYCTGIEYNAGVLKKALIQASAFEMGMDSSTVKHLLSQKAEISKRDAWKIKATLPRVIMKGKASTDFKAGDLLNIKRTDYEIKFDPLFGGKIEIDLAIMLIRKIPMVFALYTLAEGLCTFVNDVNVGAYLEVSTDKDVAKNLSTEKQTQRNTAFIRLSLILYARFTLELNSSPTYQYESSKHNEEPPKTTTIDCNEFLITLETGCAFEAKIWIFTGAYEVNLKVETGLYWGVERVKRGEKDLMVDYLMFKGVDVMWTSQGSLGIEIRNKNGDETSKGGEIGVDFVGMEGTNNAPSFGNYNSLESAEKRFKELSALKGPWEKVHNQYQVPLVPNGVDDFIFNAIDQANKAVPGYSPTEYNALNKHLKIYRSHARDLNRIAQLNQQLKTAQGVNNRRALLKERFEIMKRLNKIVKDSKLPLPPDGFQMSNVTEEFKLRDEYEAILHDEIDFGKNLGIRNAESEREKRLLQKINEDDDTGRATIFPHYFLSTGLESREEEALRKKLTKTS